jgi:ribonuclease HI
MKGIRVMEKRSREKIMTLDIYTDGSLKKIGTSTYGGWSFIAVRDNNSVSENSGGELNTTNQRMELTAIAEALKFASANREHNEKVIIHSDSAYAINCYLQEWYLNWEQNGWLNSSKNPVANQDLWYQIVPYFDNFWYGFEKVEGHAGNFWNEKADELAQSRALILKKNGE